MPRRKITRRVSLGLTQDNIDAIKLIRKYFSEKEDINISDVQIFDRALNELRKKLETELHM